MSDAAPPTTASPINPAEMAALSALIYRWTGMVFGEKKRFYIERRITERMLRTDMPSMAQYLLLVQRDAHEQETLINAFTVNETYFYREDHQLAALSASILPEIVRDKRPGDLVRIWSLPCSTGEEAYSIAIWLLENWRLVDAYNIEIVGSDIDTTALARAVDGYYGERALARLPAPVIESCFEPLRGHRRRIIQDLRESVRFTPANLIDAASLAPLGRFDVILCRNLLIYFDDAARTLAVDNIYSSLNAGGFLCLGHSESIRRLSDRFDMVRFPDAIVYRRK